MKRFLIIIALSFTCSHAFSQSFTKEQIAEMTKRIRSMSPAQVMKYRDSLMKAVMGKTAERVPNGNLLLKKHTYDTTYTTVSFGYTKTSTGKAGTFTYSSNGASQEAMMLYEANGHTMVQCGNNPRADANVAAPLDGTVKQIKRSQPYMTAEQKAAAGSIAAQTSFVSGSYKDKSLKGNATMSDNFARIQSVDQLAFSFDYDPQQHYSTIAAGAQVTVYYFHVDGGPEAHTGPMGIGCGATTDPSVATIAGGKAAKRDPEGAYAIVSKTPNGFKISYTKITKYELGSVTETLTATIGEPVYDYEAVIKPYKFNYEHWLPKGPKVDGSDDNKGDDSSRFTIFVQDKNDANKQYPGNFTVKWKLKEVTRYPGFCSNYPLPIGNPNKNKDLAISDSMKTDFHFNSALVNDSIATGKQDDGILSIVRVMCLDYAAWGKLYAEVTLDNGQVIAARPYYRRDGKYLTIPFDEDENRFADEWEAKEQISHKGYGFDWDEDVKPDNNKPGDDIALIDEYRGFLIEDENYKPVHQRFSANTKDLITIALADKSKYGKQYKDAVRRGVFGYGKVTTVKMHHLTNSAYGQAEPGIKADYGRWVNWNSPLKHHTDGVMIYCFDTQNPDGVGNTEAAEFKRQSLASTGAIFDMNASWYEGGQPPSETNYVMMWIYDIVHFNQSVNNTRTWYLPKRPEGNDGFNQKVNKHVRHANAYFGAHIDTLNMGTLVDAQADINIGRLIAATIAHELCHATGIHHHHFGKEKWGDYFGVASCPMRYWFDTDTEGDHADWIPMFVTGLWDPSTETTPEGNDMKLCQKDDNCFKQLQLKKY